jgi:hypothetical protein
LSYCRPSTPPRSAGGFTASLHGALEPVKATVQREFQTVMLDQMRRQDEEVRDSQLPHLREVTDDRFGFFPDEEPLPGPGLAKTRGSVVPTSGGSQHAQRRCFRSQVPLRHCQRHRYPSFASGGKRRPWKRSTLLASEWCGRWKMEAMVREQRGDGENGEHYFEEIQLASKHNLHFAKTLKGGRAVIMLVTKRNTSLGMGWSQLKAAIPVLERLIP